MIASDILVVGAGPAGLAVSACLRDAGLPHTLVERETEVASSWHRHYARLHLHTVKQHSALPGMHWPRSTESFPSREAVIEYLNRYAAVCAIAPAFGVEVQRITRDNDRFSVATNGATLHPRFVVVATGYNRVAKRPDFEGIASFPGPVVHSSDYRHPKPFRDMRTLVVGCGNSGAEIALDLAEHGVDVSMVVRGPVHVVPRELFGRPTQKTAIMFSVLPIGLRDALIVRVLKLAVGDLSKWGIVRPDVGPQRMVEERGRVPILDIGTVAMIKAGRIAVRQGVKSVNERNVQFADGVNEAYDAIILATGYTPGLQDIVHNFNSIADERQRPNRFAEETAIRGLYFVGYRNPPTGALREIAREAKLVVRNITSALNR